ncbi:MFS transporter [Burkholderia diffusa]|uniref:MFS transporter n=1 Tax=Burkholderia diffusa TaxID=488732 RepID=UPI00157B3791|nr:MFS transporter [Burkholderia diffusa]NTY38046.1 MHS family MFS transporter [Burkholderia diffusa]
MTAPSATQPIRAALGAFLGTMIEWYDFFCFGTAAALVFGDVFFASEDPAVAALASLGTFAIGFIARPVGAIVFGHLGDRIGRKASLIVTLLIMGIGTTLMAFIPSYHSIGIAATAILIVLRLVQGVAVGGEWGGAVLIAAEHAPERWRTFLAAAPQYGSPVGLILSTLMFRAVSGLPKADFQSWGWRIPFLASAVLVGIALLIRATVKESPELERRKAKGEIEHVAPLRMVLQNHKKALVVGICLCLLSSAGFYFLTTLMITYTTTFLKVSKSQILDVIAWVGVVELIALPIGSLIAHAIGERKFLMWVTAALALWALPMMHLIGTGNQVNIAIAILVAIALIGAYYAVIPAFLPRAFPVEMRYTGISLCFQLCGAIFGGTTPLVGVWLAKQYNGDWLPLGVLFLVLAGANFLASVLFPIEDGKVKLRDIQPKPIRST